MAAHHRVARRGGETPDVALRFLLGEPKGILPLRNIVMEPELVQL